MKPEVPLNYVIGEFHKSQNRGYEDGQKIRKFFKKIYTKTDFLSEAFRFTGLMLFAFFFELLWAISDAIRYNVLITNTAATEAMKNAFTSGSWVNLSYIVVVLTAIASFCTILAFMQVFTEVNIKKVMKKYHIDKIE